MDNGGGDLLELDTKAKPFDPPNEDQETHRTLLHVTEHGDSPSFTLTRHILLPVDDTPDSEAAVDFAINNIYRDGDVFHLLHVIPEASMVHVWAGVYIPPDEDAERVEIDNTKVFVRHRFAKKLLSKKIPFQLHVIVGTVDSVAVADTIVKRAALLGCVCVVMARHTKGKLKEMFVGSVTANVSKRASTAVTVVPAASSSSSSQ